MKYTNQRTDEYGGSFENRYRFPVEIVQAIKKTCGEDYPVSLRYSVISKTKDFRKGAVPGETDYIEVGRDLEESEKAAKFLQDAGYDMLNCDNGTYDAWYLSLIHIFTDLTFCVESAVFVNFIQKLLSAVTFTALKRLLKLAQYRAVEINFPPFVENKFVDNGGILFHCQHIAGRSLSVLQRRQVFCSDVFLSLADEKFCHVAQLSDIASPGIMRQRIYAFRAQLQICIHSTNQGRCV